MLSFTVPFVFMFLFCLFVFCLFVVVFLLFFQVC